MGACDRGPYRGHHLGIFQLSEMGERFLMALNALKLQKMGNDRVTFDLPDNLNHKFEQLLNLAHDDSNSEQDDELN